MYNGSIVVYNGTVDLNMSDKTFIILMPNSSFNKPKLITYPDFHVLASSEFYWMFPVMGAGHMLSGFLWAYKQQVE
jgi:hypothetical protein